jgi:tripartite-type tricarboxylate transporter receptor subunit TctC
MKTVSQRLSLSLAVCATAFATSGNAPAQERQPDAAKNFPNRPVRVIVTTAAGGASDYVVRPIAQKLSENLKQNFVIDNRAGASGIIAMEMGAKAPPDGYTLLFATIGTVASNFAVHEKLPYHPIKDYAPISKAADTYFILSVHPGFPANTVQELVAMARAQPGKITYATYGVGSFSHLLSEWFSSIAGVKLSHIPYKGSAPAVADLIAGQVNCAIDTLTSALPHVRTKRLRALAIGTSQRYRAAPDIPTFAEAGYAQFEPVGWWGFLAPANTPQPVVIKLNEEIRRALAAAEVRERLEATGAIPVGNSPEEFAKQIKTNVEIYAKVAREANIRAE